MPMFLPQCTDMYVRLIGNYKSVPREGQSSFSTVWGLVKEKRIIPSQEAKTNIKCYRKQHKTPTCNKTVVFLLLNSTYSSHPSRFLNARSLKHGHYSTATGSTRQKHQLRITSNKNGLYDSLRTCWP